MLRSLLIKLSPPQVLVLGFAVIIFTGAFLLASPLASLDGHSLSFTDALFTATSATCVTGLVVVDTGTHFTLFGQVVIMVLIQVGGIGFTTTATLFVMALRKRISLKERLLLQESLRQGSMEGIVRLIRNILLYSLTIEFVGFILLALRWSFDFGWKQAFYYAAFHSISFFNNAGFVLLGTHHGHFSSLTAYVNDPLVNFVTISLVILGGIGFIVMADVMQYRVTKRLSLHSKVVLSASALLIVGGACVLFLFEYTNALTLGPLNLFGKIQAALFQSVSPRSGGVNTLEFTDLRQASQFFIVLLMFIGAAPGSTGGGIKITTFALLAGAMTAMIRGKEDIVMFRFRLAKDQVYKAITLTLFAIMIVSLATMALSTTEDRQFLVLLFEVISAFGTVGHSLGVTPDLTPAGKIIIIVMMFAGRLGPLTLAYALGPVKGKELYRHPEGKINIG